MTMIRLYNSASRKKEDLTPIDPSNVRMYVCGPTVYDRAHLGNARPVVVFDVLFRLLRHVYGTEHVTYVRNFTDVDDKINTEALRRRQTGAPGSLEDLIRQRTEETIGWYHADMDALGALRPTAEPRATEFIASMVAMIEMLIAKRHAYVEQGHVLFDVRSYAEYGKLSGRSVDDMIAGARAETAPGKRDPMDFVLWKPSDAETPGWASPWGRGRPGWHIECSAMSHELLGPAFDIHGGGIDLAFPHHENEIAQSRCAHPDEGFAKVWMHNEMLLVEGKKMSKSLGNFFTVREEIDKGIPAEELRMAFLLSHYSDQMDLDRPRRSEAQAITEEFSKTLGSAGTEILANLRGFTAEEIRSIKPIAEVVDALSDDLDTRRAIGYLRKKWLLAQYSTEELVRMAPSILASQMLLGFDLRFNPMADDSALMADDHKTLVGKLDRRSQAMATASELITAFRDRKDYGISDQVRAAVLTAGAEVSISGTDVRIAPTSRFDFVKLEELLEAFVPLLCGTRR